MKNLIKLSLIALAGFFLVTCDHVANVIETTTTNNGGGGGNTDTTIVYRKVLIEDFTGHKCQACPTAAKELRRLDSLYHGKLIPMAVHAGTFANPNPTYPDDFRTPEGAALNSFFGFSAYPNGLVNRKDQPAGAAVFIKGYDTWATHAVPMMSELADFKIDITNTYTTETGNLQCVVDIKALNDLTGKYNLSVYLTEDSIVGPQLDGSTIIPNYVFMHVMRGSLNTVWGEEIWNGTIAKNVTTQKTYNYTVPSNFVAKHCHIIAYVYDNDSGSAKFYEVKQAEVKELIE
ncbi:MAG TPA: Omp28 family outer membrane lipoprotein [Bacteroidia bacterium]